MFENDTIQDLKDKIRIHQSELLKRQMNKSIEAFKDSSKLKTREKFSAIFSNMDSELFLKLFVEDFGESFIYDLYLSMDDKFLKDKMKRFQ